MSATKSRRGRPPKLDDALATQIAAHLLAGRSVTETAQIVGVSRRTIERWRRQAWSRDARDRSAVVLAQMLERGWRAAAAETERTERTSDHVIGSSALQPLDELLRDLDDGFAYDLDH